MEPVDNQGTYSQLGQCGHHSHRVLGIDGWLVLHRIVALGVVVPRHGIEPIVLSHQSHCLCLGHCLLAGCGCGHQHVLEQGGSHGHGEGFWCFLLGLLPLLCYGICSVGEAPLVVGAKEEHEG